MSETENLENMLKNFEISSGLKIQTIQGLFIYEIKDFIRLFTRLCIFSKSEIIFEPAER